MEGSPGASGSISWGRVPGPTRAAPGSGPTASLDHVSGADEHYLLRTLYDARAGGFYGSQAADPAYYRLPPEARRAARRPPVSRDKVSAWNAEAALAFLALGQSSGRADLLDAARRTLEFMRRHLVTEKGVFHLHEYKTGRGLLRGQIDANAWAALAFLEGYRVSGVEADRQAAERVLNYAKDELFDTTRGAFVEERDSPLWLDANGVMAEALIRAYRLTGRRDYLETATRVLAALGSAARARLVEDEDVGGGTGVADAVFYLTARGQVVAKP